MKVVPPSSYIEAYKHAMDLESEQKTSKKKKKNKSSDSNDSSSNDCSSDEEGNKKVQALQKDMLRIMKEFKNMQKGSSQTREEELWYTDCKVEGHTKGRRNNSVTCARL